METPVPPGPTVNPFATQSARDQALEQALESEQLGHEDTGPVSIDPELHLAQFGHLLPEGFSISEHGLHEAIRVIEQQRQRLEYEQQFQEGPRFEPVEPGPLSLDTLGDLSDLPSHGMPGLSPEQAQQFLQQAEAERKHLNTVGMPLPDTPPGSYAPARHDMFDGLPPAEFLPESLGPGQIQSPEALTDPALEQLHLDDEGSFPGSTLDLPLPESTSMTTVDPRAVETRKAYRDRIAGQLNHIPQREIGPNQFLRRLELETPPEMAPTSALLRSSMGWMATSFRGGVSIDPLQSDKAMTYNPLEGSLTVNLPRLHDTLARLPDDSARAAHVDTIVDTAIRQALVTDALKKTSMVDTWKQMPPSVREAVFRLHADQVNQGLKTWDYMTDDQANLIMSNALAQGLITSDAALMDEVSRLDYNQLTELAKQVENINKDLKRVRRNKGSKKSLEKVNSVIDRAETAHKWLQEAANRVQR